MKALTGYWTNELAAAKAAGDEVKVVYTTWKLDPRAYAQSENPQWELLRQAGLRFRDNGAENTAIRALGYYTGD